jgi:hypothetical protein
MVFKEYPDLLAQPEKSEIWEIPVQPEIPELLVLSVSQDQQETPVPQD